MTLRRLADEYRLKLRRDPDDDTDIIPGREGHSNIFEYGPDLLAVMVLPYTKPEKATAHRWKLALPAFNSAGMVIRQNGDCEGTATFDASNPAQVRLAMKYAKVRPKRQVSEAERERLRNLGTLRQNDPTLAVRSDLTAQDREIAQGLGMRSWLGEQV
jgi:hypothetical protein